MDNQKLSIIVPVYNIAPYLDECLASLCGQTYENVEIICIDDGSSDGSLDCLRAWEAKDSRVVVVSQPNSGVSRARNHGLDVATGDYVAFVDGDDYIDRDAVEKIMTAAVTHDADIVIFGGRAFPETAWVTEVFGPRNVARSGDGASMIFEERGCIPSAANKAYRRSLIENAHLRFCETLVLGEDTSLQFLIFPLAHTFVFLSDRLYHYRFERAGSAVTEGFKKRFEQLSRHVDVLRYICQEWSERGYLASRKTELLEALGFIWNDYDALDAADRIPFAQAFCEVFYTYFAPEDIQPPMSRRNQFRYTLFLELGQQDVSDDQVRRATRRYQRQMQLVRMNQWRMNLVHKLRGA